MPKPNLIPVIIFLKRHGWDYKSISELTQKSVDSLKHIYMRHKEDYMPEELNVLFKLFYQNFEDTFSKGQLARLKGFLKPEPETTQITEEWYKQQSFKLTVSDVCQSNILLCGTCIFFKACKIVEGIIGKKLCSFVKVLELDCNESNCSNGCTCQQECKSFRAKTDHTLCYFLGCLNFFYDLDSLNGADTFSIVNFEGTLKVVREDWVINLNDYLSNPEVFFWASNCNVALLRNRIEELEGGKNRLFKSLSGEIVFFTPKGHGLIAKSLKALNDFFRDHSENDDNDEFPFTPINKNKYLVETTFVMSLPTDSDEKVQEKV